MKHTYLHNHKVIFLVLLVGLTSYSSLLIMLFTPGVMVNDDVAMMAFANGDFTGSPEFQLVFIGPLVGKILQSLYLAVPALPWYPILLVALQIGGSLLLLWTSFSLVRRSFSREWFGLLALVVVFTPVLTLDISFSSSALYVSSCVLLSLAIAVNGQRSLGKSNILLLCILWFLASSLRFNFFLAAVVIALPVLLFSIRGVVRNRLWMIFIIMSMTVVLNVVEREIGTSGQWRFFQEFNSIRSSLHDSPGLTDYALAAYEDDVVQELRSIGWESEDVLLFSNWYLEDSDKFNSSSLGSLRDFIDLNGRRLPAHVAVESMVRDRAILWLSGTLLVLLAVSVAFRGQRLLMIGMACWAFGVGWYIAAHFKFPDRFALGYLFLLFSSQIVVSVIAGMRSNESRKSSEVDTWHRPDLIAVAAVVTATVFVVPHNFAVSVISQSNETQQALLQSELKSIDGQLETGRIAWIGNSVTMEGINPWTESTFLHGNKYLGLGWASQSPHQESRKSNMGFTGSFLNNFVDNPNNLVLTTPWIAELLTSYLQRRGSEVEFQEVVSLNNGSLFRVVQATIERN